MNTDIAMQLLKRPLTLICILLAPVLALAQQSSDTPDRLAPFYPTPELIVEKMLQLAELKPGEHLFDLGSGDGRIVIMAAQKYGAIATGIEIDRDLYERSVQRIKKLGLQQKARIIHGDILKQDYSSADVVTVYLLPSSNEKVRPLLEKQLKKGARVVCHDFEMSGWTPERVVRVEDQEGRQHTLFLYRR